MDIAPAALLGLNTRGLDTMAHLLRKGAKHAEASGQTGEAMLEWRLADDMFPLRRQVQIACDFAVKWPARLAGEEVPASVDGEPNLEELLATLAEARSRLARYDAAALAGRAAQPLTLDLGVVQPTLPLDQWIVGFAVPNFYFHLATAYDILRHHGVPLGKADYFAGGLA